jgi:hypothetical protein
MYEENIRNLIGQRQREQDQAMMSKQMTKHALKKRNMNQPFEKTMGVSLSNKQQSQINSVTNMNNININSNQHKLTKRKSKADLKIQFLPVIRLSLTTPPHVPECSMYQENKSWSLETCPILVESKPLVSQDLRN